MIWVVLTLLVAVQAVAGAFWWRLLKRGPVGWVEAGGMGLAVGTALAVLAGCLGFWLPTGSWMRAWAWVLPAVAALVVWIVRRSRGLRLAALERVSAPEGVAVAIGLVVGVVSLAGNLATYPLTWVGEWTGYHQDMVFFEALASGTSAFAPFDSVFMAGADFRYHWLTYAWVGQLTEASGAAPFMVLTRVLPVVALVGSVLVAVAWARRLSLQPWVPAVAALLLVSGGYVGAIYGAVLNFDSPSQALTTLWLLGLSVALLAALRGGSRWGWAALVLLLCFAVAGGKFSSIVVAAGGFGLVTVVGVVTRAPWRRRAVLMSAAGLVATALSYVLLVSGSAQAGGLGLWSLLDRASSVQGLNPQTTDRGIIVGTALLILAMVARWAGLVWLGVDRRTRWSPETVLGLGMAVVGVLTIALVSGGFNDMWFALAASAPIAVLSAAGLGNAAGTLARGAPPGSASAVPRRLVVAFVLGAGAAVPVALVWGTGAYSVGGWRWAAPLVGLASALVIGIVLVWSGGERRRTRFLAYVIAASIAMAMFGRPLYLVVERVMTPAIAPHDLALYAPVLDFVDARDRDDLTRMSADQMAAGAFLRETSSVGDLVATNVTYSPLVAALSGRRTFASGIHYQAPYGRPGQIEQLLQREAESWAFVDAPSSTAADALCSAGVDWLWVDPARTTTRSWLPWATVVQEWNDVILLRLEPASCRGSD